MKGTFNINSFSYRPFYDSLDKDNGIYYQNYDYAWNSLWLVAATMTTVGFGDYYPVTLLGKATILVACFSGIFIVSMTMVTLNG